VVRWRVNGSQRARRFQTEAEAIAFDEGVSGGTGKTGSSTPNVYPYETSEGTRWRYSYGHLEESFLKSAPAKTEQAIRAAGRAGAA
jgi:hypothetical protein